MRIMQRIRTHDLAVVYAPLPSVLQQYGVASLPHELLWDTTVVVGWAGLVGLVGFGGGVWAQGLQQEQPGHQLPRMLQERGTWRNACCLWLEMIF